MPARAVSALAPGILSELRPARAACDLRLGLEERASSYDRYTFSFSAYSELRGDFKVVTGDFYRSRTPPEGRASPLLVVSPILAASADDYLASRYVCYKAARAGFCSYFLHQQAEVLDPEQGAWRIEAWLRESVRDNLQALELFAGLPEIDASRVGSYGISVGAIKNVALLACEPRLRANVLALAGADVAAILLESREPRVERYVRGRKDLDGLGPQAIALEFRRWFHSDPARFAPAVDPARVLLILGRYDDVIPPSRGEDLRRALGGPAVWSAPFGHYSAVIGAPWFARVSLRWLDSRLDTR